MELRGEARAWALRGLESTELGSRAVGCQGQVVTSRTERTRGSLQLPPYINLGDLGQERSNLLSFT